MRRVLPTAIALPLLLLLLLFSSCDLSGLQILEGQKASEERNTFIIDEPVVIPSSFSLLLTTDQHFIRKDSGVYYETEAFFIWVEEYQNEHTTSDSDLQLTHMISMGDITENSQVEEFLLFADFAHRLDSLGISTTLALKGNHDIRPGTNSLADWKTHVEKYSPYSYHAFVHKGVSFYLLDTANRTLGRIQMQELQEAVKKDDKRPKLFFSHMPLYGKPFLPYTVLSDSQERESLIRLMVENKGLLFLAGHHHQGDILHSFRRTTSEFILGAFHGRNSLIETIKPRWYLLHFDAENTTITITRYQVESKGNITEKVMAILPTEP